MECIQRTYDIHVLTAPAYLALPGCVVSESTAAFFNFGNKHSCFFLQVTAKGDCCMQSAPCLCCFSSSSTCRSSTTNNSTLTQANKAHLATSQLHSPPKPKLRASTNEFKAHTSSKQNNRSHHIRKHQRRLQRFHQLRPQPGQKANQLRDREVVRRHEEFHAVLRSQV